MRFRRRTFKKKFRKFRLRKSVKKQIRRVTKKVIKNITDVKTITVQWAARPQDQGFSAAEMHRPIDVPMGPGSTINENVVAAIQPMWGSGNDPQNYVNSVPAQGIMQGNTIKRVSFSINYSVVPMFYNITVEPPVAWVTAPTGWGTLNASYNQCQLRISIVRPIMGIDDLDAETYLTDLTIAKFWDKYNPTYFNVLYDKYIQINYTIFNSKHYKLRFSGKRGSQKLTFPRQDDSTLPYTWMSQRNLYLVIRMNPGPTYTLNGINYALFPTLIGDTICKYVDM